MSTCMKGVFYTINQKLIFKISSILTNLWTTEHSETAECRHHTSNVEIKPVLIPLSGETFTHATI